jgi:diaminohydroxyphosphoribosylaminopyrimidine deaminase/5-amino-6-(5-phosphoribosylamino)uracil reductase
MRASVDAILVGAETVRRDNPQLTVRNVGKRAAQRQPWRVVLTRSGKLPTEAHLFTDEWKERTLVYSDWEAALKDLGARQVTSLLVEGGGEVLGSAFDENLVDRVAFFYAPMFVGGDKPGVGGVGVESNETAIILEDVIFEKLGPDLFCAARVKKV